MVRDLLVVPGLGVNELVYLAGQLCHCLFVVAVAIRWLVAFPIQVIVNLRVIGVSVGNALVALTRQALDRKSVV